MQSAYQGSSLSAPAACLLSPVFVARCFSNRVLPSAAY